MLGTMDYTDHHPIIPSSACGTNFQKYTLFLSNLHISEG